MAILSKIFSINYYIIISFSHKQDNIIAKNQCAIFRAVVYRSLYYGRNINELYQKNIVDDDFVHGAWRL